MRIHMDLHQKGINPHAKIHYFCLMGKKCSLKMRKNTEFMLPLRNDFIINVSP